jgi:hypothetical protein
MNTKHAKALLAALKGKCFHGSSYTCGVCEARITAEVWFEGSGFTPATLRVALKLAEALEGRPESEHDGGCSAGISKLPCKCSQKDRTDALAEWKKL